MKWSDRFYLRAYLLAKDGHDDYEIAQMLGVSHETLQRWKKQSADFRWCFDQARKSGKSHVGIEDYVHQSLPDDLKQLWEDVCLASKARDSAKRIEHLFKDHGLAVRQHIFLHAYMTSFDLNHACRVTGINMAVFEKWKEQSPEFGELCDTWLTRIEDEYIKSAFFDLVGERNPSCVLHGMKSRFPSKYGEKKEIQHTHQHEVNHTQQPTIPNEIIEAASLEEKKLLLQATQLVKELQERANARRINAAPVHGGRPLEGQGVQDLLPAEQGGAEVGAEWKSLPTEPDTQEAGQG